MLSRARWETPREEIVRQLLLLHLPSTPARGGEFKVPCLCSRNGLIKRTPRHPFAVFSLRCAQQRCRLPIGKSEPSQEKPSQSRVRSNLQTLREQCASLEARRFFCFVFPALCGLFKNHIFVASRVRPCATERQCLPPEGLQLTAN